MATNPFLMVPPLYRRYGYLNPIDGSLRQQVDDDDDDAKSQLLSHEEEEQLQKELDEELEADRNEFIRRQKESMDGYHPARVESPGPDYSKLLELPDKNSREGVKAFQKELNKYGYNLSVDGMIGPKTMSAFNDYTDKVKARMNAGEDDEGSQEWLSREPRYGLDAIGVSTEQEQEQEQKKDLDKEFVNAYGALVPSFFSRMLDMSKPSQYLTADERMRSSSRLARNIAPFADSGMAKNIYADAINRMKTERERADAGEQNVLQRRTTAENMWGHYSPAITQALTNSSVFMQRAYQAEEEAKKLEGFSMTASKEAEELENIIRDQYEQKKVNFYMKGKPISFDQFRLLVEGNKLSLIDSPSIETNEVIADLAGKYRNVLAKKAQAENFSDEAQKNRAMAMQQQSIADANKNFAKESQAFFGFPTIKLPDIRFPDKTAPRTKKPGTLEFIDNGNGQSRRDGSGNLAVEEISANNRAGSGNGSKTEDMPSNKPNNPADTGSKETFENYLEKARQQYLKFEKNNRLIGSKHDAQNYSKAGLNGAMQEFKKAYDTALNQKKLKEFTKFVFDDFRFRDGANNAIFQTATDPAMFAFTSRDIYRMLDSRGLPEGTKTNFTNIVSDLASKKLSYEQAQDRLKSLASSLSSAGMLPTDYKVEAYPDGSDIAIIPKGMTIWKDKKTGKITLKLLPEGRI